jgi:hypothetical protein
MAQTRFVSQVINNPRGFVQPPSIERARFSDIMVGTPDEFGEWGRKTLNGAVGIRASTNRGQEDLFLKGGYRNMIPKPQPAGSFIMPFNQSGNAINAVKTGGAMYGGARLVGGARTLPANEALRRNLQRRAEQIEALKEAQEEGLPPSVPTPPLTERTEDSADKIAVELTLQDAITKQNEGMYEQIDTKELNKAFQAVKKLGAEFSPMELKQYTDILDEAVREMILSYSDFEGGEREGLTLPSKSTFDAFVRIRAVFRAWYATLEIADPKARAKAVATLTKDYQKEIETGTKGFRWPRKARRDVAQAVAREENELILGINELAKVLRERRPDLTTEEANILVQEAVENEAFGEDFKLNLLRLSGPRRIRAFVRQNADELLEDMDEFIPPPRDEEEEEDED